MGPNAARQISRMEHPTRRISAMSLDSHTASATLTSTAPTSSSSYAVVRPPSPFRALTRLREAAPSSAETIARAQSALEREFIQYCPRSTQLYTRALQVFPGGVTHDNRRVLGNSLFVNKAR